MSNIERICVFGDSTAWGAWDCERGGWVNRLWLFVGERYLSHQGDFKEFYNLSISGATSQTILDRFENEVKIREAEAIIFQTGNNDSAFLKELGNYWIKPDQFRANIEEIIKRAKNITSNIIFIGAEKMDETKTKPVSWADVYYVNESIKKYNDIMQEACLREGVLFLDTFNLLDNNDLKDGVHPNSSGHTKIFEKVKECLINQAWI
ncbi:MAG: GDSL-type esterase/lipase family protein [Candidatus Falkowbacteria bacterium]|nr:GDSL-type esterase/lipase family protein [Candidatus Falkowbacteria bacterium]